MRRDESLVMTDMRGRIVQAWTSARWQNRWGAWEACREEGAVTLHGPMREAMPDRF